MDEKLKVQREFNKCYLYMFLAVLVPTLCFVIDWRPAQDDLSEWFQRSGSVSVIFGVLSELTLVQSSNVFTTSILAKDQAEFKNHFLSQYNFIKLASAALAIVGTLIWGYGDLWF